ncbi:Uncharacterised protein [BD1-7 clade bacterium]|uniref:Uncharacterized protein n=1 Tax=BD1-7 clade bacterium TaxID=2029982 RepID=A0A5S9QPJ4_9GAMM|nr:Uncharacterised protein [BD1-7 clade bacterium]
MKKSLLISTILFILSQSTFAREPLATDETKMQRVTDAASFDLNCAPDQLSINAVNPTMYIAEGCGHKTRYNLELCASLNWASTCTALQNGPIHKI